MPHFAYTARDKSGTSRQGDLDAPSRKDALRMLATRGLQTSTIVEMSAPSGGKAAKPKKQDKAGQPAEKPGPWEFSIGKGGGVRTPRKAELLPFLEALQDLITSGLSAGEAVRLLSLRITDPRLKVLSVGLWERISEGSPLSRAMEAFPEVFDTSTINLIQAGEATGSLIDTNARLIAHLTEQKELRRLLLTSLAYPIFMTVVAFGVVMFFLFFLLPKLQGLLDSLGGQMPMSTRIMIGTSNFLLKYGIFIALALILGGLSFWRWRVSEAGRKVSDAWLLRLPLVGPFAVSQTVLSFSQTLGVLLENGITMSEALKMTERQIANRVHRQAFVEATARVLEGEALSIAITKTHCFPELVLDRLAVGENTGNVVRSLKDIAKGHQKIISNQLNMFTKVIASAVLMCVFLGVGFVAFAIVTAIFSVSTSF